MPVGGQSVTALQLGVGPAWALQLSVCCLTVCDTAAERLGLTVTPEVSTLTPVAVLPTLETAHMPVDCDPGLVCKHEIGPLTVAGTAPVVGAKGERGFEQGIGTFSPLALAPE